ncbi:hypothetical protein [Actinophytocola sp.]|uniref:hypothetical protein n=1 Tax=Actinophytocola sp. TaxID=1872138 RepID=UPI002ED8E90A
MRWWKIVGLAGLAGVAATGAVIARSERRRRAYTPEEIRDKLHQRVAEAASPNAGGLGGCGWSAPVPGLAGRSDADG